MQEEKYIEEKGLENQPTAIPLKVIRTLEDISKTHICKIYCKDGKRGNGFFCNITNDWDVVPALMTNYHVLEPNDIQPGKTIEFSLDNDLKKIKILIDNERKTYSNKSYDVTIIEIKKDDNINRKSFFELDQQIFKENAYEIFRNCQIFLLHVTLSKGNRNGDITWSNQKYK